MWPLHDADGEAIALAHEEARELSLAHTAIAIVVRDREALRREHGEDFLAKYFAAKRRLITKDRQDYSMDDCVAVWSVALETDLFPWFRSYAFDVDATRTDIELDQGRS